MKIVFLVMILKITKNIFRDKFRDIKLDPLRMSITVSKTLDMELSAVRGLWLKRDLFSDYCPSFKPSHEAEYNNLADAVETEMKIRCEMREKHLDEMRKVRMEYDKKIEALAKEETKKKTKPLLIPKKVEKIKKKPDIEPPKVDEKTYVDVDEEYIQYENMKFEEEIESLSPINLNLNIYELNLREYQILGGIYKIECLLKPLQTKELSYQMFIRISE